MCTLKRVDCAPAQSGRPGTRGADDHPFALTVRSSRSQGAGRRHRRLLAVQDRPTGVCGSDLPICKSCGLLAVDAVAIFDGDGHSVFNYSQCRLVYFSSVIGCLNQLNGSLYEELKT